MNLTDSQKISVIYKQLLGIAETSLDREFFQEPFKSGITVTPDMIWRDSGSIPDVAPDLPVALETVDGEVVRRGTSGVIAYYEKLQLNPIAGADKAYYHDQLKNAIPFNWDIAGSYRYYLYNSADTPIAFGVQDWSLDPVAGIVKFYGDAPSNVGITPTTPPKISFYRYIGRSGGTVLPLSDVDALLFRAGAASDTARFLVRGGTGETRYTLPAIDGALDDGVVLVEENLNSTIDDIGVIDGGEWT